MDDRKKYGELLRKNLKKHLASLCEDCNSRFNKNVLRILDCKKESCRKIIKAVPAISDSLCSNCNDHYRQVKELLKQQKVEYVEDRNLVRGLDYYTNIVFEVTHNSLGSQDAIGAGGRYDGLIKLFGGPDTPGVGFALGLERLLLASELSTSSCTDDNFMVYFATIGDDSYKKAFELVQELRKNNVGAVIDYQGKSLKAQMNQANKLGVSLVAILGSDELKAGTITLRDMKTSKQNNIKITNLLDFTKSKSKNC